MLIFLHGFLGEPDDWLPLTQFLNLPYQCLLLPGHKMRPFDLNLSPQEIPYGTTLVGYSLGGRLAMHFALRFPKHVKGLILLSANPGIETQLEQRKEQDEKWAQCLEKDGLDSFLEKWYSMPLFNTLKIDLNRRKGHDPCSLARILRELSPAILPNLWPRLKDFSCPLLFLFGEGDIKYQSIGTRLENEGFAVAWAAAGHALHLENPRWCADILGRYYEYFNRN